MGLGNHLGGHPPAIAGSEPVGIRHGGATDLGGSFEPPLRVQRCVEPGEGKVWALIIDLRSDTVTRPTSVMRQAMAVAEVGDDVYGEDPTVRQLEQRAADLAGKEAGLFVPSGTMGNLVAAMTHLHPGDELFAEAEAHILYYEQGGCARLAGAMPHPIRGQAGRFSGADLRREVRPADLHFPRPGLVAIENTHNRSGGEVWTEAETNDVLTAAHELGLATHLDGARLFNAATALGVSAAQLASGFDSVSICLSKGLGAPVGSVLCGSRDFIGRARRNRKVVGGGMRQAGVLAAAGLAALSDGVAGLADDHRHAAQLAEGLAALPGLQVAAVRERTNMVMVDVDAPAGLWVAQLKAADVLVNAVSPHRLRLVTHLDVSGPDVEKTLTVFAKLAEEATRWS